MAIKLGEAMDALNERIEAIGLDPKLTDGESERIGTLGDSTTRLFLSGFDLDLGELAAAAQAYEAQQARIRQVGEDFENAAFDFWLNGLLVGLIASNRESEA
jgi:hypothetical protein